MKEGERKKRIVKGKNMNVKKKQHFIFFRPKKQGLAGSESQKIVKFVDMFFAASAFTTMSDQRAHLICPIYCCGRESAAQPSSHSKRHRSGGVFFCLERLEKQRLAIRAGGLGDAPAQYSGKRPILGRGQPSAHGGRGFGAKQGKIWNHQ